MSLLIAGNRPVLKYGSAGPAVRRIQRALNAVADRKVPIRATGVLDAMTTSAIRDYQQRLHLAATGVVARPTWKALAAGRR